MNSGNLIAAVRRFLHVRWELSCAGLEIGLAEKTTRNMLSEGRFPLKTKKISNKRVVSIFDLAAFHESGSDLPEFPAEKRRGPRTKKERIEAQGRA